MVHVAMQDGYYVLGLDELGSGIKISEFSKQLKLGFHAKHGRNALWVPNMNFHHFVG
jgi:hypothetical protein